MKKKIFILLILIFTLQSKLHSQQNFGLKANIGFSNISTSYYNDNYHTDKLIPSGQIGIYYNFQLNDTYSLGTELIFRQIEAEKENKEYRELSNLGNSNSQLISTINYEKHISYIGIPIYLIMKINKLNINLGLQANYAVNSSGKQISKSLNNNSTFDFITNEDGFIVSKNELDKLEISDFDYGPRIGITSSISKNIFLEANYYFGLNNINKTDYSNTKWKVRQMTMGIKYNLF